MSETENAVLLELAGGSRHETSYIRRWYERERGDDGGGGGGRQKWAWSAIYNIWVKP